MQVVAIVGRPNVGKSTLFNKLVGQRLSIVDDKPGVTRDRIYSRCEWLGKEFMLIDTGGIEPKTDDVILAQMREQAMLAVERADAIIFVTDITTGVTANDSDVASMLIKSGKPGSPRRKQGGRHRHSASGNIRVLQSRSRRPDTRFLRARTWHR